MGDFFCPPFEVLLLFCFFDVVWVLVWSGLDGLVHVSRSVWSWSVGCFLKNLIIGKG